RPPQPRPNFAQSAQNASTSLNRACFACTPNTTGSHAQDIHGNEERQATRSRSANLMASSSRASGAKATPGTVGHGCPGHRVGVCEESAAKGFEVGAATSAVRR